MEETVDKLHDLSIYDTPLNYKNSIPYINWTTFFAEERTKPYYNKLITEVHNEYENPDKKIYPDRGNMFKVFGTGPANVNVVILGQDPYNGPGQANGLSFSVERGASIPPILKNIFKESGQAERTHGDLTGWADQGVLLLNTVLTVEESKPKSHAGMGWETFTDSLIRWLSTNAQHHIIFVLLGTDAFKKKSLIDTNKHTILVTTHPSPLSAHKSTKRFNSFIGSNIFEKINEKLRQEHKINWKL